MIENPKVMFSRVVIPPGFPGTRVFIPEMSHIKIEIHNEVEAWITVYGCLNKE